MRERERDEEDSLDMMRRGWWEYDVTSGKIEGERSKGRRRETIIDGMREWRKKTPIELLHCVRDSLSWTIMAANTIWHLRRWINPTSMTSDFGKKPELLEATPLWTKVQTLKHLPPRKNRVSSFCLSLNNKGKKADWSHYLVKTISFRPWMSSHSH